VIEEIPQGQEGLDAQAWRRRRVPLAARERIEQPGGQSQRQAVLAFHDQPLRGLPS
jgi:hypothetical protein